MRRLFAAMPSAVDNAVCRAFEKVGVTTPQLLLEDFRHFFTRQMFGDGEIDGILEFASVFKLLFRFSWMHIVEYKTLEGPKQIV